jgi:flagellar biosynthesis protein FlhF
MAEVLARVTAELGSDAVVLHTRQYRRGGILGLGAKPIIEVTAADAQELRKHRQRVQGPSPRAALLDRVQKQRPAPAAKAPIPARHEEPSHPMAGELIKRTYAAAKAELTAQVATPAVAASASAVAVAPSPPRPAAHGHTPEIASEMREVKRMVARMMRQQQPSSGHTASRPDLPDTLFDQYLNLIKHEVAEELADEVVAKVRQKLSDADLGDEVKVRCAVRSVVAALIPTDPASEQLAPTTDGRPRTIALIGPTGVGKTTTIAKLAATFKLKHAKRVGLVTLDTYRIAAVDQLKTYANIIGVPLAVAMTPDELRDAIHKMRGCDVVLIDTAGRSQRDDPRLDQLKEFIRVASPHHVHLVLSSTCTQSVLLETIERFSRVPTDSIIFTKLDEAVSFGVLLNVTRKVKKRLSYLTTGQEVPHQIEPSRPERLAELVMGQAGV